MANWLPTADLADKYIGDVHKQPEQAPEVRALQPVFRPYGAKACCCGPAQTIRCFESNVTMAEVLQTPGEGRVLVVDAGASMRCGMLGDNLAAAAVRNGWQGVIVYGCIRDSGQIEHMALCIRALNTFPVKSTKASPGVVADPVHIAGATVRPGEWVYIDHDGILVSSKQLTLD